MEIITGRLDGHTNEYPLSCVGERDGILALDIETTGLSPAQEQIYLIGCACWQEDHWKLIQWFDETGREEADILTSFLLFAKKYRTLLHYNGTRFDLPFLSRRIVFNGLQAVSGAEKFPDSMQSVDLYRFLRPYQKLLSLPDLRQQTVERFVGTGRTEDSSGRDLVKLYREYLSGSDDGNQQRSRRDKLLSHNLADIGGLVAISDTLSYADLFTASLNVYKAQATTYRGADGDPVQELIMSARADNLPGRQEPVITTQADSCYISIRGSSVTIRVPVYSGRIHYYYANYKDYYYLPELDQAVHKSLAAFVDKDRRVQATAETCYTAKVGSFLPEWTKLHEPFFKRDYHEKEIWFELKPEMKKDRSFFTEYANYVYRHVIRAQSLS